VIKLGLQYFVVDIMHEPTQLYCINSEKAKSYMHFNMDQQSHCNYRVPVLRPELSCNRRFMRLPNLREKAVFHENLGHGGCGSVYRITLGGLSCALKKIDFRQLCDQRREYALKEVQVMEMLKHENIVHYLGHEYLEDKKELHILMELFPSSLRKYIEKKRMSKQNLPALEIKHLAIEILNGIDYLHNQKILHRDLKSANILVDMDENDHVNKVKITDFGVCKVISEESICSQTRVGTEIYMAPEVHANTQYTVKADIWSFGMVLVELITMAPPYDGHTTDEAAHFIRSGILPPLPSNCKLDRCQQKIVSIIQSCLEMDPEKRPTAENLIISFFRLQGS